MKKRINLHPNKLWDFIYPLYANMIVFGTDYETFAQLVAKDFDLIAEQWEVLLENYEFIHGKVLYV